MTFRGAAFLFAGVFIGSGFVVLFVADIIR